jgi:hypothetical protein
MTVRPEDLRGEARDAFRMWRDTFGLSEAAAMNALVEDGVITLSEDEKFARSFQETWGLSRAAAEIAARGRDGGSRAASSGVSVAELAALRPDPANVMHVVAAIEELATELRGRGFSEGKARYEAAFALMHVVRDERAADWIVKVAEARWPGVWSGRSSFSGTTVQG